MMSRYSPSHSTVWPNCGNPAKFVQSNSFMVNKGQIFGVQGHFPAPVTVPVVKTLCKSNHFGSSTLVDTSTETTTYTENLQAICIHENEKEKKKERLFHKKRHHKKDKRGTQDSKKGKDQCLETPRSSTVEEALDVIERRKKSIKAKLLLRKENCLSQEEEQDIHTRADLYAITTMPDSNYFLLPEDDVSQHITPVCLEDDSLLDSGSTPPRKKRRRNYGNTNCYVNHHNHDDIFDNTKMLPLGTRLMKPPTKLVELVAKAINGSPDGLLQVQQIYSFLQNKYPFFRYMDRVAINSWRSSIRHALYQKWFRKIRFELSFISSKGCYWAINHKNNPKEWSLPDNTVYHAVEKEFYRDVLEEEDDDEFCEVAAIAQQLMSGTVNCDDMCDIDSDNSDEGNTDPAINKLTDDLVPSTHSHVPSPVHEPDPILATCAADWDNDDLDESGHGTMTPAEAPPYLLMDSQCILSQDTDFKTDFLIGTPVKTHRNTLFKRVCQSPEQISKQLTNRPPRGSVSPMVNWTPNWDDYGSYILSPQNIGTQKLVFGLPGGRLPDGEIGEDTSDQGHDEVISLELNAAYDLLMENTDNLCSNESDSGSCDFEIIAEFDKSETSTPEYNYCYDPLI